MAFNPKDFAKRLNPTQQKDFSALTRNTGGNFTNLGGEQGLMKRYGVRGGMGGPIAPPGPGNLPPVSPIPGGGIFSPTGPGNLPTGRPITPPGPPNLPPMGPTGPIDDGGVMFNQPPSLQMLRGAGGSITSGATMRPSMKVIRGY